MPQSILKSDNNGPYIVNSGDIIRPVDDTVFNEGDSVDVQLCKGTIIYGVGKDEECSRGEYLEAWFDTGITVENMKSPCNESHEVIENGRRELLEDYPIVYNNGKFSFKDVKSKHNELVENGQTQIHDAFRNLLGSEYEGGKILSENDLSDFMQRDIVDDQEDDL